MLLNLGDPVANALKGSSIRHVVHQKNSLGTAEVRGGDGAEAFLSGRIPNLKLDALVVHFNVLDLEIDSDGGDEGGGKRVVGVTKEETGFPDSTIANHEQLALHVVRGGLAHFAGRYYYETIGSL